MGNIFLRNQGFLDLMSLVHLASGLGMGIFFIFLFRVTIRKAYYKLGCIVLVVWEIFEFFLRFLRAYYPPLLDKLSLIPRGWSDNESVFNISSDLMFGFLGLLIVDFVYSIYKTQTTEKKR